MKKQHVESYFDCLAGGNPVRDADFQKDPDGLRIDLGSMPAVDSLKVKDLVRQAAKDVAEAREAGHTGRAREIAREAARQVTELVGDRFIPEPKPQLPDDPRELIKNVRRF